MRPARAHDDSAAARAVLEQLIEALQAEAEALMSGDTERLGAAIQNKERVLQRLPNVIGSWERSELRQAVRQARELNDRNGRLLSAHMSVNQARIQALFGKSRTGMLYAANGRSFTEAQRPAQRGVRA